MAQSIEQNPLLTHPTLRGLLDLGIGNATLPLTLPATLGTDFKRYATEDLPGIRITSALGIGVPEGEMWVDVTYERRLIEEPVVTLALSNDRAGVQEAEEIAFTLGNMDGALNALFFSGVVLQAVVRYHLYDRDSGELQPNIFCGVLSAYEAELDVIHCRAARFNVAALAMLVPRSRVTAGNSPGVLKSAGPNGSIDSVIPTGTGVGRRIPGRWVRGTPSTKEDTGQEPEGLTDPGFQDFDLGKGNLTIDRLWASDSPVEKDPSPFSDASWVESLPEDFIFETLHREYGGASGGKYRTAVRFRNEVADQVGLNRLPVTADVQRVCPDADDAVAIEMKFNRTFAESMTGTLALGFGDLSPADCITGPSGVGLGAILLDGVDDYLNLPCSNRYVRFQTFTVEVWIRPSPVSGSRTIMSGPTIDRSRGVETSWYLEWIDDGSVRFGVFIAEPGEQTPHELQVLSEPGAAASGAWHLIVATCDPKLGLTRLFVDRVERGVGQGVWGSPFRVLYGDFSTPIAIGRPLQDLFTTAWFSGAIGFVRISAGVARNQRYVDRSWWLMRRNPMEFLREFVVDDLYAAINPATWDQAAIDMDSALTTQGGELKADGFLTEETTAQAVIESFLPFRDPRFWLDQDGALCVAITKPATRVVAHFGIGDQYANIVEFQRRSWPSLTESIRTLPIKYRWQRDNTGAPRSGSDEFGAKLEASVMPVGIESEPLLLPFVYDHTTAEAIKQWEERRRRTRAELLEITVGHEGRHVVPDPDRLVQISIDTHGLDAAKYEVVRATPRVFTRDLALCPYDESVFLWEKPTTVPEDPRIDTVLRMDIGNAPRIIVKQLAPRRRSFDLFLGSSYLLAGQGKYPGQGFFNFFTIGIRSAPSQDALHVLCDGDDATYCLGSGMMTLQLDASALPAGARIRALRLIARMAAGSGSHLALLGIVNARGGNPWTTWTREANSQDTGGQWRDYLLEGTQNPLTRVRWRPDDFANYDVGVEAFGDAALADVQIWADVSQDYPGTFLYSKLWLLGPYETAEPEPPAPSYDAQHTALARDLFDLSDGADYETTLSPGWYFPFARLYDVLGRPSRVIGPTPFQVT